MKHAIRAATLMGLSMLAPQHALAYAADLYSSMSYVGVTIDAPAGVSVDWRLPWYGEIDAEAADSTPAARAAGAEPEGNALSLAVQAPTPLAFAYADILVVDGDGIGGATLCSDASSPCLQGFANAETAFDSDGAGTYAYAYAYAGSYFENRFQLTGVDPDDSASVRFALFWASDAAVVTDQDAAFWETWYSVFLTLYDPVDDRYLDQDALSVFESGAGEAARSVQETGTLSVEYDLLPGRNYLLFGAADVSVYVSLPPTSGLFAAGVLGLVALRRRTG